MRSPLVDPLELPSVPLSAKAQLPDCPAIYFVMDGQTVLYIGKAVKLSQRWAGHHRFKQVQETASCPSIAWMEVSDHNLLGEVERTLIEHFQPRLNRSKVPYSKRTTVSFEDEHYAILERWADKEVRSVGNLVQAIVVSVLRGEPFDAPEKIPASPEPEE